MPDALSKTVPIWCCVLNRAMFPEAGPHPLYTPPQAVSPSEHSQIEKRIDGFVQQFKVSLRYSFFSNCSYHISHLTPCSICISAIPAYLFLLLCLSGYRLARCPHTLSIKLKTALFSYHVPPTPNSPPINNFFDLVSAWTHLPLVESSYTNSFRIHTRLPWTNLRKNFKNLYDLFG